MYRKILFAISGFFVFNLSAHAGVLDSIGVQKKDGKTYVVHQVEAKETLYAISKKYGVTVDEIKKENPDVPVDDMKIGQTLLIPKKFIVAPVTSSAKKTHTVEAKETLYSISKKYNVTVDELKNANPGSEAGLEIGQVLVIPSLPYNATSYVEKGPISKAELLKNHTVETKETWYSISKKYDISVDELKNANTEIKDLKVGQSLVIPSKGKVVANTGKKPDEKKNEVVPTKINEPARLPQNQNTPTYINVKKDGYTKVSESGMVEMYEANADFHYALHKTAPVGTIIYVVNEENGQKVYVRVMGRLTDAAPGVIMKVSKKAFDKISKDSGKVKVSASYIP